MWGLQAQQQLLASLCHQSTWKQQTRCMWYSIICTGTSARDIPNCNLRASAFVVSWPRGEGTMRHYADSPMDLWNLVCPYDTLHSQCRVKELRICICTAEFLSTGNVKGSGRREQTITSWGTMVRYFGWMSAPGLSTASLPKERRDSRHAQTVTISTKTERGESMGFRHCAGCYTKERLVACTCLHSPTPHLCTLVCRSSDTNCLPVQNTTTSF